MVWQEITNSMYNLLKIVNYSCLFTALFFANAIALYLVLQCIAVEINPNNPQVEIERVLREFV